MALREKHYTSKEFEELIARPENAERRFELFNGELIEKMPTQIHAFIAGLLSALFHFYLRQYPIGWVFTEIRINLPDQTKDDVVADVAFALKQGRKFQPFAPVSYMPELVVEIQSVGQSDKFMSDKAHYYLENGAQIVWIIYPVKRLVEVLTSSERHLLTIDDMLGGGDVLPGFSLSIHDLFPEEDTDNNGE